jgi:hypothetical protein
VRELAAEEPDAIHLLAELAPRPAPLPAYAMIYWNAFAALQFDRAYVALSEVVVGEGGIPIVASRVVEQPITFLAIDRYAERFGLIGEPYARFCRLLRAMDDEYRRVRENTRNGIVDQSENEDED